MYRTLVSCLCLCALGVSVPSFASGGEFSIKAEPVDALEGGPVVIKATVTYRGNKPREIEAMLPWPDLALNITAPKGWVEKPKGGAVSAMSGRQTVKPSEEVSTLLYAHHQFTQIPKGKASLKISLSIVYVGGGRESVSTTIELDVPEASPERLEKMRKKFEETLDKKGSSWEEKEDISKRITWAYHEAFAPLAFRLMKIGPPWWQDIRRFVYDWSQKSKDIHHASIEYLRDYGGKADSLIFGLWRYDKVELPRQDIAKLLDASDLWVRVLTYHNWPAECAQFKDGLLAEISELEDFVKKPSGAAKDQGGDKGGNEKGKPPKAQ